ncbi:MAG: hypothetical protein LBE95_03690, partial [Holosporaceae bacterium]|nr:hypothetical protein [Holosporaceae bacterium]
MKKVICMALMLVVFFYSDGLDNDFSRSDCRLSSNGESCLAQYEAPEGIKYWKSNGEYLMSDEFMDTYMQEGC